MTHRSLPALVSLCLALTVGCDAEPVDGEDDLLFSGDEDLDERPEDDAEFRAFQLGTTYIVKNVQTGQCADVPWGSPAATVINQFPCHSGPAQQFIFDAFIGSLRTMRNVSSNECLTAAGYSAGGYGVGQTTCNAGIYPQSLSVQTVTNHVDGATVVLNSAYDSGLCLQAPNTTNSAPLRFELCDGGMDQRWRLQPPVNPTCSGFCGGRSEGTCWCDDLCTGYGDCCDDYQAYCG